MTYQKIILDIMVFHCYNCAYLVEIVSAFYNNKLQVYYGRQNFTKNPDEVKQNSWDRLSRYARIYD